MAEPSKDTIYIDVDDEITSVIEKVQASKQKIVALVLPKRAAVLQSIVNMKLLKRTAEDSSKKIVLITSEAGLLPLAGAVGMHVAKTLQSKPAIPPPPDMSHTAELVDETGAEEAVDKTKSIGELAGVTAVAEASKDPDVDTINVDSIDDEQSTKDQKKSKKGKSKVPNFESFRLKLFLIGGALVLLLILWFIAGRILPKATITIHTNAVSVDSSFDFTVDTSATSLDTKNNVMPATAKDSQQTNSQKVAATGEKNVGEKASGSMTMYYCPDNNSAQVTVPSGTAFTANGVTFRTKSSTVVPASNFTGGGDCKKDKAQTVGVTADQTGSKSNLGARAYSSSIGGVSGQGSDMTGGTDKTVTVVSQSDIDEAKKKITANTDTAKSDLNKQFQDAKLFALPATLLPGKQVVSSDAKVDDQTTEVTVTVQTDYTMLGIKQDDLQTLINNDAKSQIDTSKQKISDYGLNKATFSVKTKHSPTNQTLSVQTTATAGAQIDIGNLKQQITGKKRGDVQQIIQQLPNVQSVDVSFSPFWVYKTPSNSNKITIVVQNQQASTNGNSSN